MASRAREVEKVTVSLPAELVRYADQRAAELGTSRSQVISRALAELQAREQDATAREGYAFYARESQEFAAASLQAVSEAIGHAG
ncbi:MAG: ribbon-helix-helix protein, CopG family [Chloroflexi bacterium]|nr:ribbon-helix-helix protein, CopG family [Chloroflexota bacterium]